METKQVKKYYDAALHRRVATVLPIELARKIKIQAAAKDISIQERIAEMLEFADKVEQQKQSA